MLRRCDIVGGRDLKEAARKMQEPIKAVSEHTTGRITGTVGSEPTRQALTTGSLPRIDHIRSGD